MKHKFLLDQKIRSDKVLLKSDNTLPKERQAIPVNLIGAQISKEEAIKLAESLGHSLIEIVLNEGVSICVIASIDKYLYRLKRKEEEVKKKNKTSYKVIRLNVTIQENDLNRQIAKAVKYLDEKSSVRIEIRKGTMPRFRFTMVGEQFANDVVGAKLAEHKIKYKTMRGIGMYTIIINQ